jgi:hypothetical protein
VSDAARLCEKCNHQWHVAGCWSCLECCCMQTSAARDDGHDPVAKPAHYSWIPGIECKDVVQHFNYYVGCAIKYLWRYQHKGNPIEDLKKSREYIDNEIARLEKEQKK